MGEFLGKGQFGTVRKCISVQTNEEYAIKIIIKQSLKINKNLPRMLLSELQVLQDLNHPNIM